MHNLLDDEPLQGVAGYELVIVTPRRPSTTYSCSSWTIACICLSQPEVINDGLVIVTRDMWGARLPSTQAFLNRPAINVFYSLTYTRTCDKLWKCAKDLREMQTNRMNIHKDSDIPYNFLLGSDGRVYEGRGWMVQPKLPRGYTSKVQTSIFIVFIAPSDDQRCLEMHDAKYDLIDYGVAHGYINGDFLIYDLRKDDDDPPFTYF